MDAFTKAFSRGSGREGKFKKAYEEKLGQSAVNRPRVVAANKDALPAAYVRQQKFIA